MLGSHRELGRSNIGHPTSSGRLVHQLRTVSNPDEETVDPRFKPSTFHSCRLDTLPAFAKSQSTGRANGFSGDLRSMTVFSSGTIPEEAASS